MTRAAAELRQDLAVHAARTRRDNTPIHLVWIAGLLFTGALLFLIWGVVSRLRADAEVKKQEAAAMELVNLAGELRSLDEASAKAGRSPLEPIANIQSRIANLATSAGMRSIPSTPTKRTETPSKGIARTTYEFDTKDESLEAILKWAQRACEDVPGLEVYSVTVKPEATNWSVKIKFSRWEKVAG